MKNVCFQNLFLGFLFYLPISFFHFFPQTHYYENNEQHKKYILENFPSELLILPKIATLPILFIEQLESKYSLILIKQHGMKTTHLFRKVCRIKNVPYYFKIWNENYFYKDLFLKA